MKLGGSPTTIRNEFDLFLVSFLSLFLEILLIRWIGTEIRVFAYFANLTLVTCFFGLGAGYASRRIRIRLVQSVWLLVLLCVLAHPALDFLGFRKISESVAAEDINIWEIPNLATVSRLYGFGCMGVILLIIAAIFIPFGNLLGDYFDQAPRRIRAYSINLAGSLAGIWLFALLGYLHTPPVIWFGVAGILYLWLVRSKPVTTVAGIITLGILLITSMPTEGEAVWSSYQKLVLMPLATTARAPLYRIEVNNTFYQYATDFSDKSLDDSPVPLPAEERP
ncbi:hypothetical protein HY256_10830, partial [Candidatus Sumerlaeota bacterium]|nr:hypothetical protein [Candidatus Sumerlaeota bacterium]